MSLEMFYAIITAHMPLLYGLDNTVDNKVQFSSILPYSMKQIFERKTVQIFYSMRRFFGVPTTYVKINHAHLGQMKT